MVIRSRVNITMPWRVEIGDHVWIGDEVLILSLDQVKIGSNVCLSQRAFLCTGNHDFRSKGFDLVTRPIEICDSSWIAACAFVGPGAVVGPGTMVRAGEKVPRDQGSGIGEQGSGNREQGAGSREQGAGSREQGAGSRKEEVVEPPRRQERQGEGLKIVD